MQVRVATSQFKVRPIDAFADFARHVEWHVHEAARHLASVLVFPEYFTAELLTVPDLSRTATSREAPDVFRQVARDYFPPYRQLFSELAARHGLSIVGGSYCYFNELEQQYFNASFLFTPDGGVHEQRKTHVTYELVYNRALVSRGHELKTLAMPFGTAGIAVCYDVAFPENIRLLALRGMEVLFNPACIFDAWGVNRLRAYDTARATENQCYVVGSQVLGDLPFPIDRPLHFEGISSIHVPIDRMMGPEDGVLARGEPGAETVVVADLDLDLLRRYRSEGIPSMLKDRRPELYAGLDAAPAGARRSP